MNLRNAIIIASLAGLLGGVSACTNPEVPAGHEGYIYYKPLIFSKMEYRETLRGPASTGVSWRLYAVVVDMRARSFNEHFELLTKDNLKVSFEVNTRIQPKDGQVKAIVEDWGAEHWYDWNVKEPLRTIVRETVTEYKATEIQLDTPDVKARIEAKVSEKYAGSPFMILSVDIGDIQFPALVADAIQKKIAKNEDLKRQEFVLEKAKKEAAITVLGALRVAEQQRIISSTLDPLYVQRKAVEVYRSLGNSKNKTIFVLPNSPEGTGMPLVMSKGQRKVLSAADERLLDEMEKKYMAMARRDGPSLMDDPTKPDGDKPAKPDGDKPAPDGDKPAPDATPDPAPDPTRAPAPTPAPAQP
jgi:regulator of protease activity HflC (stomatin/prohibitin superfamily)